MSILEIAEELRLIAERKSKETGKSIQEVWKESVEEFEKIYKEKETISKDEK